MKTIITLFICSLCTLFTFAQDAIVTTYKDGHVKTDKIDEIEDISFVSLDAASEGVLTDVSRGLLAYFDFDSMTGNDSFGQLSSFLNGGTFVGSPNTPSESGKALKLGSGQYMDIASAPLNGRKSYSVSLWIKDFGSGPILSSFGNGGNWGGTMYMTEEGKLLYCAGEARYYSNRIEFSTDLSSYVSDQWVMLTVVTTENVSTLYVNGRKASSGTVSSSSNSGAVSMCIGGKLIWQYDPFSSAWADPMKIDNVRLYGVALTDDEIMSIYKREKHPAYDTISPLKLDFNAETANRSFTIKNNIGGKLSFHVSDDSGLFTISPKVGQIPAFGTQQINVSLDNRDEIGSFQTGNITINIADTKQFIPVTVEKGKNVVKDKYVTRGLQAYYTFDDKTVNDVHNGYYPGELTNGSFVTDTPNGNAFSLRLLSQEQVSLNYAPLNGRNTYSISLWIKDFGSGPILSSYGNGGNWGGTMYMTEEGKLLYCAGEARYYSNLIEFSTDLSSYVNNQWVMLTVVTTENVSTLYVNGRKASSGTVSSSSNSGAESMCIGGKLVWQYDPFSSAWAAPMKIDNVRLYSVALTDEEIQEIYYTESK